MRGSSFVIAAAGVVATLVAAPVSAQQPQNATAAVNLNPVSAGRTTAYAGASYRWRALVFAGEVESGTRFNYAFRVATRV